MGPRRVLTLSVISHLTPGILRGSRGISGGVLVQTHHLAAVGHLEEVETLGAEGDLVTRGAPGNPAEVLQMGSLETSLTLLDV